MTTPPKPDQTTTNIHHGDQYKTASESQTKDFGVSHGGHLAKAERTSWWQYLFPNASAVQIHTIVI